MKIVCERTGKETVKTLFFGSSKGRLGSVSTNKQEVGRELMSRIQVEQMGNTECLAFVRALRPFKVRKYRLEKHSNYGYLAEADRGYLQKNTVVLTFDDAGMEAVRVRPVGEEKEKAKDKLLELDETKSKRQMERDRRGKRESAWAG